MTDSASNHHPSVVASYQDAKDAAAAYGYQLFVTCRAQPVFALAENGATLRTFTDIAHVEDWVCPGGSDSLRGMERERGRRRAQ